MRRYHLSCGDSTRGPVGVCGAVVARNKKQALLLFRRALEDATGGFGEVALQRARPEVEYMNVYINPDNIQIDEIDPESA